jgi:uncharacterized protein (DUF924 family)
MSVDAEQVLDYWFGAEHGEWEAAPGKAQIWFRGGEAVDREIGERFGDAVRAAVAGELEAWAATPRGRLALVILLDQMSRNVHRGSGEAFAGDPRAHRLVEEGLARGVDRELRPCQRPFLYMALVHAEDLACQDRACALFEALAAEAPPDKRGPFDQYLHFARLHRDIIARFGRFPGRNARLGRESTPEERDFLAKPGSSFG